MGKESSIAWTNATWNFLRGCEKVSPGCANCYAERYAARFSGPGLVCEGLTRDGKWTGEVRYIPSHLLDPFKWSTPRMIFVNSQSDTFHDSVSDDVIGDAFAVAALNPRHTFQFLTKRAERMWKWFQVYGHEYVSGRARMLLEKGVPNRKKGFKMEDFEWPLKNAWLGVSVEIQSSADRILLLSDVPAAVRWVSAEPLLTELHLTDKHMANLDWLVVGAESGPKARPMNEDWVRSLRNQSTSNGIKFFYKQNIVNGEKIETPEIDGTSWVQYPGQDLA